jgi:hypothetical protein
MFFRSVVTAPVWASGTVIVSVTIGSSSTGRARAKASRNASLPALRKATSLLSTEWALPSVKTTRTSWTGEPDSAPASSASWMPRSTEPMNWCGIAPPNTSSTNSKPSPRPRGSIRRNTSANCPAPPVCFFSRKWPSATAVMVSRYDTRGGRVVTDTPKRFFSFSSTTFRCSSPRPLTT